MRNELREQVIEALQALNMTRQGLAVTLGKSRTMVTQYLNGKYESDATELESSLEGWLTTIQSQAEERQETKQNQKVECFESADYKAVLGVCTLCQHQQALGIIVGKSGYGKTYALRQYAKMPKVIYIECNETMSCRDLIRRIESKVNLPKIYGSNDERMERIKDFFNVNEGYVLLVDEADKLISKYTIQKIEILRNIADGAKVGVVLAGELALENHLKAYDTRFANRMDFYYKLSGLSKDEVLRYLDGFELDAAAANVLVTRANHGTSGCFRLFDRTIGNILRVLERKGTRQISAKIIDEASAMMML